MYANIDVCGGANQLVFSDILTSMQTHEGFVALCLITR